MSGVPDRLVEERREQTKDGEPILSDSIKIQLNHNGTFSGTILDEAVRIIGFQKSQKVDVDIYEDRYVIHDHTTEDDDE